ncbi:MAG: hypothetical protein K2Q01_07445, partial [Rickettsiales bacterium]|nr:hypothetical protein [Rickettsiales bacterium]
APEAAATLTPAQKAAEKATLLKTMLTSRLANAFAPTDAMGKFMRESFARRHNNTVPDTAAMATAIATPELGALFAEGGDLVRKNADGTYALTDEQAFQRVNTAVSNALTQITDPEMRAAMAEQISIELLEAERQSPQFARAIPLRTATQAFLNTEVDLMLGDKLDPEKPGNEKLAGILKGMEAWNGGKIDMAEVRKKAKTAITAMLADKENLKLSPQDFHNKLNEILAGELCHQTPGPGGLVNDCGFRDAAVIAQFSPVVSAMVTDRVFGEGRGNVPTHELNLLSAVLNARMSHTLNHTEEGRTLRDWPNSESLKNPDHIRLISRAMGSGLLDLQSQRGAIQQQIDQKNREAPGSGDRWGFDHAMNVLNLKIVELERTQGIKLDDT